MGSGLLRLLTPGQGEGGKVCQGVRVHHVQDRSGSRQEERNRSTSSGRDGQGIGFVHGASTGQVRNFTRDGKPLFPLLYYEQKFIIIFYGPS